MLFVVCMVVLFLVGIFAELWIVGVLAVLILLSFMHFREVEGLLPLSWIVSLGAGCAISQLILATRDWSEVSAWLGQFLLR